MSETEEKGTTDATMTEAETKESSKDTKDATPATETKKEGDSEPDTSGGEGGGDNDEVAAAEGGATTEEGGDAASSDKSGRGGHGGRGGGKYPSSRGAGRGSRRHTPYGNRSNNRAVFHSTANDNSDPSKRVYVGNLSWSVTWKDLKDLMKSTGCEVTRADILASPDGRSKGCGIVEFETAEGASRAVLTLNDTELMGRQIFVREDREDGSGGGYYTADRKYRWRCCIFRYGRRRRRPGQTCLCWQPLMGRRMAGLEGSHA